MNNHNNVTFACKSDHHHIFRGFQVVVFFVLIFVWGDLFSQKTLADEYPNQIGNLWLNTSLVNFQNVNNWEIKTDTLKMYNNWGKRMSLSFETMPEYLQCKAVPKELKPHKTGYILITYNAAKCNYFGYVSDRIKIVTDDSVQPKKTMDIAAYIIEDFSKMTPEQLKNAAKIKFENTTYNFDTIAEGTTVNHDFKFWNVGVGDLYIRKIKSSGGGQVGNADKIIIKQGDSSFIHLSYCSNGKSGYVIKNLTIQTNDPTQQEVLLTIKGWVKKAETNYQQTIQGTKQSTIITPQH